MQSYLTAPTLVLMTVLAASLLAAAAVARPDSARSQAAEPAPGSDKLTTGSIDARADDNKRFEDCLAIWDPGTHMTKRQWRRTCKSSLENLPGP